MLQLVSLVVTLGAQVLIAQRIGPGLNLDTYFTVIGFAGALVGSIANGATYLLPASIRADGKTPNQQATIAGHGVVASAAAGIMVSVASAIFFILLVATGKKGDAVNYDIVLVLLGWTSALTSVLFTSWGAVGTAHGRVTETIIFSMVPAASMATYLVGVDLPTVVGMAGAQLAGICLQAISLAWCYRMYWTFAGLDHWFVGQFISKFPLAAAGTLCFSAYAAVDAWLAPSLGVGAMSHQSLAQRLVIALGGIISAGPFMLAPSITATMLDEERTKEVWKFTSRAGICLTALCLIASAATLWVGQFVIGALFQRGEFGPNDTKAVTTQVTTLLLGAGPMLASGVVFRVLHTKGCVRQIAILSLAWVILYALLAKILAVYFDALSLSLAYVLAWSATACGAYITLARALNRTRHH